MRETDSGNTGYSFWHPDLEVSSRRQVYVRIMIAYVIMCTIGCRSTYNRTKEDDTNLPIRKVGGAREDIIHQLRQLLICIKSKRANDPHTDKASHIEVEGLES